MERRFEPNHGTRGQNPTYTKKEIRIYNKAMDLIPLDQRGFSCLPSKMVAISARITNGETIEQIGLSATELEQWTYCNCED